MLRAQRSGLGSHVRALSSSSSERAAVSPFPCSGKQAQRGAAPQPTQPSERREPPVAAPAWEQAPAASWCLVFGGLEGGSLVPLLTEWVGQTRRDAVLSLALSQAPSRVLGRRGRPPPPCSPAGQHQPQRPHQQAQAWHTLGWGVRVPGPGPEPLMALAFSTLGSWEGRARFSWLWNGAVDARWGCGQHPGRVGSRWLERPEMLPGGPGARLGRMAGPSWPRSCDSARAELPCAGRRPRQDGLC